MGVFTSDDKHDDGAMPVPGTVHLVDLEGTMMAKHAKGARRDIVLVPAPSSDPDDPLNWSPARKALSTASMGVYTLMVGIASAAIYSVLEPIADATGLTLADLNAGTGYFQHERGTYIALYALLLAGSNFLAPILAGFIADGQGWKWVLYWCAIFCAIGFVFLFFFMEETNYSRPAIIGHENEPDVSAPPSTLADADEKRLPHSPNVEPAEPLPETMHTRKTYLDKIKLWQAADMRKPNHLAGMVSRPLIFLTFPVIAYAGFSYGSNLVWFNVLNGTASLILGGAPYNFPAWAVGLSYVSPLVGVAIGSAYTGYIGDRIVLKLARRNKGVLEPEFRLWLFLPSLLLVPFGLILWGVGAAHAIQWFGCVFAMGVIALTNTLGIQLSVSYCIDSYKDLSGEAMVTVILVRNTMSFAINYGLTPWVTNLGLQNAFIVAAFAGMAQVATFYIFVRYGKTLRRRSAARYAVYVEKMASSGMIH
ncbi:hypothetical protein LTR85_002417 [Meristemomyces frigidus]|nr:hypothetical protein LTR85_002417 [Meristemomyces frigidus]